MNEETSQEESTGPQSGVPGIADLAEGLSLQIGELAKHTSTCACGAAHARATDPGERQAEGWTPPDTQLITHTLALETPVCAAGDGRGNDQRVPLDSRTEALSETAHHLSHRTCRGRGSAHTVRMWGVSVRAALPSKGVRNTRMASHCRGTGRAPRGSRAPVAL